MTTPGTATDAVIEGLERVRKGLCGYMGPTCDCKYGGPSHSPGSEQTGCPEIRRAIGLLVNLRRAFSGEPVMTAPFVDHRNDDD